MLHALVTGGAGFLGSHLCRRLLKDGYAVTALDNLFTGSLTNVQDLMPSPHFTFLEHDIVEPFEGTWDEIYNLACPASPIHYQSRPIETTKASVLGILNVLACAERNHARVLHTSTSEIYGDPLVHPQVESYWGNVNTIGLRSCYDEGKRCAETLCADYHRTRGLDVRLVRIFNTYGPNMQAHDGRVISNFIMQALTNQPITLFGEGLQTRSFQYCEDLIEAFRRYMCVEERTLNDFFAARHFGVSVLNIGNPGEYTIRQLAEEMLRQIPESTSQLVFKPLPSDDPKRRKPDITWARELLNWQPRVPLQGGLKRTIDYFRKVRAM